MTGCCVISLKKKKLSSVSCLRPLSLQLFSWKRFLVYLFPLLFSFHGTDKREADPEAAAKMKYGHGRLSRPTLKGTTNVSGYSFHH